MTGQEWARILLALAILTALFVFPVITVWLGERRKSHAETHAVEEPSSTQE